MNVEKRKRSANWQATEKTILLDLVTEHFSIIENKKTDAVTMRQKLAEWKIISDKYNARTMFTHRSAENMKAQWESMKKAAKKEASNVRMHLIQTGGGPSSTKPEDPFHRRIISLITPSAVGLYNPFDNDNIVTSNNHETENFVEPAHIQVIEALPVLDAPSDNLVNLNEINLSVEPVQNTSSVSGNEDCVMNWGDYTPQSLQTPISKPLQVGDTNKAKENRQSHQSKNKHWFSRRRPVLPATSNDLNDKKIEAISIQMEHARTERDEANKIHLLELEIKKEILKQEKIKTRLLLMQLKSKRKTRKSK